MSSREREVKRGAPKKKRGTTFTNFVNIGFTDNQFKSLDRICEARNCPRSEFIRSLLVRVLRKKGLPHE